MVLSIPEQMILCTAQPFPKGMISKHTVQCEKYSPTSSRTNESYESFLANQNILHDQYSLTSS